MHDFRKIAKLHKQGINLGWFSRRAPGTPQALEALFDLINMGNMGTGAFRFARANFEFLSDEEIWHAYEMWCDGKFDKSVIDKKLQWQRKKPL